MGIPVELTSDDQQFADELFRRYSAKEGSQYIAGRAALAYLSAALRTFRPRTVLECGAGIGTITDALLSHARNVERVISTEHDEFCLRALAQNLAHHDPSRLTVVTDRNALAAMQLEVDMIVGDGGYARHTVYRFARPGSVVLVEGGRIKFRNELMHFLGEQGLAISFNEYGAPDGIRLIHSLTGRLHALFRPRGRKGCWIGNVESLPSRPLVPAAS